MSTYKTGTVSVTNGSATVTGSGTAWSVALVAGGMFSSAGVAVPIASVGSDTSITLDYPWPGSTASGAAYSIALESSSAASVVNLQTTLSRVLVTLSLAGITPNSSGSLTDRAALTLTMADKGYLFLRAEIGVAFAFYRWTGTSWDGPFAVGTGVVGGGVNSLVSGTGITVDNTNPQIPVVNAASMSNATIKGRASAGTGAPEDLTLSQVDALQVAAGKKRGVLTAARTFYVRTDGADTHDGLTNAAGGAFLTVQKAIDVAASLDTSIYDVTIQIGAGTYDIGNVGLIAKSAVGAGSIIIVGNEASPSTVVLRTTGVFSGNVANLVSQNLSTVYKLRGVRIESTGSGISFGLLVVGSSRLEFQNIDVGAGLYQQLRAADGGVLIATGPYSVSGSSSAGGLHWSAVGGAIIRVQSQTVTFAGTLSFGSFASSTTGAIVFANGITFAGTAGSVTGTRYAVDANAVISINGAGATYFPGNAAGTVTNGGQYV
ncbi:MULTISPECIES: hypothetical protein [unclassified Mesorhizobium]|uniref:hypothetical protein n=1 Tax=unclassified Mesorhizobium TaxID=325217 RepID=UPI000F75EB58|nr:MULTISPECIES: hypothetical protein [unclassified Mesorhizobium]AZO54870.1 hypothetical protein EJ077_16490 [Mesorhizobium sp. M8A.F.Ca.ET.057.01.1.1]RWE44148.1 MAG: hypothetical protein EOS80_19575 [Mesorhizobium sp.]